MIEEKKNEVWSYMIAMPKPFRGHGLTDKRIERLKVIVWNDRDFWMDVISRHDLRNQTLDQLKAIDIHTYNHCVGNFWSMLYQSALRAGVIRI